MVMNRLNEGASDPRKRVASPFRCLAWDPGGTTGYAKAQWIPQTIDEKLTELNQIEFTEGQLGPDTHYGELWQMLKDEATQVHRAPDGSYIPLEIVCENFQFRQNVHGKEKTKVELISCEYIGIIRLFCEMFHVPLTVPSASSGKTFIPDKGPQANVKLKQLGIYTDSHEQRHANDAKRHLLRYLTINLKIREPITNKWLAD